MKTIDVKDKVFEVKKEQLGLKAEEPKELTKEETLDRMLIYNSRRKLGLCKNDGCYNMRRNGSAYCQNCSNKHNNE